MSDAALTARLDRIVLLLVALVGIELLDLLEVGVFSLTFALVVAVTVGFALLWGRSVIKLLIGEGV